MLTFFIKVNFLVMPKNSAKSMDWKLMFEEIMDILIPILQNNLIFVLMDLL